MSIWRGDPAAFAVYGCSGACACLCARPNDPTQCETADMSEFPGGRVTRVASVSLSVVSAPWTYAAQNAAAIDRHWLAASSANPNYFNGVIYVMEDVRFAAERMLATLVRTDFKSFLYWRDQGFPPQAAVKDGFGSALIRSAGGHILLGRQMPGNINAGLTYLPGGFIDARDVAGDGAVDIKASIIREVAEETGLEASEFVPQEGFLVTEVGQQVSIALELRSHLTADALMARIGAHIAQEEAPELAGMTAVRSPADIEGLAMPPYARVLLENLLASA